MKIVDIKPIGNSNHAFYVIFAETHKIVYISLWELEPYFNQFIDDWWID